MILAKREKLEACKAYLKEEFVGIDSIIDELINYLQVWYLLPEILTRPVIVNLWGMTGVGKTDLVRKMVRFLDFQDRFAEIELSTGDGGTSWNDTVFNMLGEHELNNGKPAIVLFDEIQRFSTVDDNGAPIVQAKYNDFWELLSDGRLSRKTREDLDTTLYNYLSMRKTREEARKKGTESAQSGKITTWEAIQMKRNLMLTQSVMELTEMTEDDVIDMILRAKEEKKIYEPINHAKTLIIISGNLDEAFNMAGQTSEADIDADIFHAFSEKVSIVDIKNALSRKFRPEQVARFGNIHLIYRSLKREHFEILIQKEIDRVTGNLQERVGLRVEVDPSVNELIYRNGVFPVQGVRPVFSSVIDILEANLSTFMFEALMVNQHHITVSYDRQGKALIGKFGPHEKSIKYVGRIDAVRQSNEADVTANISVHECGHAVVYMALTGMVPLQLKSRVANSYAGGFTFPHQMHSTKKSLLDKAKIYLAGGLAEELIFGADHASVGRVHDRMEASGILNDYFRQFGFDENFQAVYSTEHYPHKMDWKVTDEPVETLMRALVAETHQLLETHRALLLELSQSLNEHGSLEAEEIKPIAVQHGLNVDIYPEGHLYINNYRERL
ncbi:hypothetical protein [Lewinella sp. 4G2]|uniref:hypothetical protein n=1 Tax=Lewinella sp. 4G2 TaxID=1803372 RepID=UPI0018D298C2|nr:hypothetical protein [Lewinella sp. 4G2]